MPQKTLPTRSARKARKRASQRVTGREVVRPRQRHDQEARSIPGDTLATVKFKKRSGTEVFFNMGGLDNSKAVSIYSDLLKCYTKLRALMGRPEIKFDPLAKGVSYPVALSYLLRQLKDLLPPDMRFNIEHDPKHKCHVITLFGDCQWPDQYLVMEVGPVVQKLYRENRKLHDLFLVFVHSFGKATSVDLWTGGSMGATLEQMDDDIDHQDEEELSELLVDEVLWHRWGEPYEYAVAIAASAALTGKQLISRAKRFNSRHPIAKLIVAGAVLMMEGHSLYDFAYKHADEDMEQFSGIWLLDQASFIWDCGFLLQEHESMLDAWSNDGIQQPIASSIVSPKGGSFDLKAFQEKRKWPRKLADYFNYANGLIGKYKDK